MQSHIFDKCKISIRRNIVKRPNVCEFAICQLYILIYRYRQSINGKLQFHFTAISEKIFIEILLDKIKCVLLHPLN